MTTGPSVIGAAALLGLTAADWSLLGALLLSFAFGISVVYVLICAPRRYWLALLASILLLCTAVAVSAPLAGLILLLMGSLAALAGWALASYVAAEVVRRACFGRAA
jgi:glucose-6-phosphate-specific signal transduction histidine kinase